MLQLQSYIRIISIIVIGLVSYAVHAQQQGLYSQYMMNYYLVNPAAAGTENNLDIRAGYRMQWAGLAGSPRNYYVSGHYPINKLHPKLSRGKGEEAYHVIGGMMTGQTLGLLSHNSGYLTYAYHLPVAKDWIVSMGANIGFSQFSLDNGNMNWGDNSAYDPSVGKTNSTNFDAALGVWVYSKNLFFGISSMQIMQSSLNFSTESAKGLLNRHFYMTGGFKIPVNHDINVIPSMMVRKTLTAFQLDINTKVRYRDVFWAGVSYRKTDAFLALIGVGIPLSTEKRSSFGSNGKGLRKTGSDNGRIEIGYSYDLITSRLNQFSGGTHEIMVALVLPKKGKVICPKFW